MLHSAGTAEAANRRRIASGRCPLSPWPGANLPVRFAAQPENLGPFCRVGPATAELEIWSASEGGFSFVISNESSGGPGLRGRPGFVASWRPLRINRSAIRVGGSPFKTSAEAEKACEAMLEQLTK